MTQSQTRKQKILGDVKKSRRQRTLLSTVIVAVLAISIVAGLIFLTPHSPQGSNLIGAPISTTMQDQLTGVSNSTLTTVGSGGQAVTPLVTITGSSPLTYNNKPEFLYVGAEYCPYCAAERWSIIIALSRFGTFNGLEYMLSGDSPEPYPNTPTFTFVHASYSSQYISFVSVETSDRNKNGLQQLTTDQNNLVNTYDCYNGQCGGIPFIDIYNKWVIGSQSHSGSQFLPSVLIGNWTQIGSQLNSPSTAIAQAVDGAANSLIKAICDVDGGQPGSVCSLTLAPMSATNMPPANGFNTIATADRNTDDPVWRNFL